MGSSFLHVWGQLKPYMVEESRWSAVKGAFFPSNANNLGYLTARNEKEV